MEAAGNNPADPPPRCYQQFFQREENDPYQGNYAALLAEFRTSNNPSTFAQLYRTVNLADAEYPSAYLACVGGDYLLVYALQRYSGVVGRPSPWDGNVYANVNDVTEGLVTTVLYPEDAFGLAPAQGHVNTPVDMARARDLFGEEPDATFVGPFANGDAMIAQRRTRKYVPLPHRYVNLFLGRKVPARQGFFELSTLLEASGDDVACPGLVDWLLVSIVRGTATVTSVANSASPTVPLADNLLLTHRRRLLERHLPGLAGTQAAANAHERMADSVHQMVMEQHLARTEAKARAEQDQAPKTVSKALGEQAAQTLLIFCQVGAEADLPKFWLDVAAAGSRDRQVLQHALQTAARALAMTDLAPVATPDLVKKILGLQWHGLSTDDLSEGIQPFSLVLPNYAGSDAGLEAQRLAETYDIMATTGTTSTLQDARAVKTAKVVVPVDYNEARAHLVANLILWTVLLGGDHPFTVSLHNFIRSYMHREYFFVGELKKLDVPAPPAALLVRYIQLRTVVYWRRAFNNHELPTTPDFTEVLERIEFQDTTWVPQLPRKYWAPPPPPTPGGAAPPARASGTNSQTPGGTRTPSQPPQEKQSNPAVSSLFAPFAARIKTDTIRAAMEKAGPPPTVARNGQQVPTCVSYHLRGECWSGCARAADHSAHSEAEDKALLLWCQKAYA